MVRADDGSRCFKTLIFKTLRADTGQRIEQGEQVKRFLLSFFLILSSSTTSI